MLESQEADVEAGQRGRVHALLAVLLVLLVAMLVFVYRTVTQDLDMRRGDELFAKQEFAKALPYYLKAERRAGQVTRPYLLYRVAASYERIDQCDRAADFYFTLLKDHPGSELEEKAKRGIKYCLVTRGEGPMVGDPCANGADCADPLVRARSRWRRQYKVVLQLLTENRAGVPMKLVEAYEKLKLDEKAYTDSVKTALRELDEGG